MAVVDDLKKLRDFLTPERWIKGWYAKRNHVEITTEEADDSCQFCLMGAANYLGIPAETKWLITKACGSWQAVTRFNDRCASVDEVHKFLDKLILDEEQE